MKLNQLRLHQYRNYEHLNISFDEGIQLLYGRNAQGKTNLLEAILYVSTTRSHRSSDDDDLIKEQADAFMIRCEIEKRGHKEELRLTVNEKGKNLFIFQNPVVRVSDFIGEFNAVMFCPDDMMLFNASPRVRRRFVDMELSKVSKTYVSTLFIASKLLKERNAYLKQSTIDRAYLGVLTAQLIDAQIIIMKQRCNFLKKLLKMCEPFYTKLSDDDTKLDVIYESCVAFHDDEQVLKAALHEKYQKNLERDIQFKQTSTGIHKEDFVFQMNDKELATYASQGQKRSVLLALKVGMVYMIHDMIHDYPVLLLDDVFSELDDVRRMMLLKTLPKEVQIFISTTDRLDLKAIQNERNVTSWEVRHGTIMKAGG